MSFLRDFVLWRNEIMTLAQKVMGNVKNMRIPGPDPLDRSLCVIYNMRIK